MGQDLLYSVMPRVNFTPSQLAYNRRVSKSDRSQTRTKYDDDHEENFCDLYQRATLGKKKVIERSADYFNRIDAKA